MRVAGATVSADAVVIGGGLAGSSVAIDLAQAGRSVVLLEQTVKPHDKVCGEFLSRETLHYLARLGVDVDALGAVAIDRVRLVARTFQAEVALPFAARSLTRRLLDEAMLQRAQACGAQVMRGSYVTTLKSECNLFAVGVRDAATERARCAVLATGKHDLHGARRSGGGHNDLVAFKMYYHLAAQQHAALAGSVELLLFQDGYAGLQQVEEGSANLCLLVTAARLRACGGRWDLLMEHMQSSSPALAHRLSGAVPLLDKPLALSSIPYGFQRSDASDGVWRVGDQAAVIPSFCGDGMAIALHSAAHAAGAMLAGDSATRYQQTLAQQLRPGMVLATSLSRQLVRRPYVAQALRVWPGLLARIALATRVPQQTMLQ